MEMKCYDVVESITDEATKQFCGIREIPSRKDFVRELCKDLDALTELVDAESFSVDIDENSMDILLSISCPEIVADRRDHPLYQILMNVKSFAIQKSPDMEDGIELRFRAQGIWGSK